MSDQFDDPLKPLTWDYDADIMKMARRRLQTQGERLARLLNMHAPDVILAHEVLNLYDTVSTLAPDIVTLRRREGQRDARRRLPQMPGDPKPGRGGVQPVGRRRRGLPPLMGRCIGVGHPFISWPQNLYVREHKGDGR